MLLFFLLCSASAAGTVQTRYHSFIWWYSAWPKKNPSFLVSSNAGKWDQVKSRSNACLWMNKRKKVPLSFSMHMHFLSFSWSSLKSVNKPGLICIINKSLKSPTHLEQAWSINYMIVYTFSQGVDKNYRTPPTKILNYTPVLYSHLTFLCVYTIII